MGLRIVKICSEKDTRDSRLSELKQYLLKRGYKENLVDSALAKAIKVPRKALLKQNKPKDNTKRPVFATTYDPRLPSITSLQAKHWRAMVNKNKYLGQVFPSPPSTGYRRQPNIRSFIVRAAIAKPKKRYPERKNIGMKRCNQTDCTSCP